jgi:hypothetical protein
MQPDEMKVNKRDLGTTIPSILDVPWAAAYLPAVLRQDYCRNLYTTTTHIPGHWTNNLILDAWATRPLSRDPTCHRLMHRCVRGTLTSCHRYGGKRVSLVNSTFEEPSFQSAINIQTILPLVTITLDSISYLQALSPSPAASFG